MNKVSFMLSNKNIYSDDGFSNVIKSFSINRFLLR